MTDNSTFGSLTAMYHTFGCKLNFAETSAIAAEFASRGIVRAGEGESPDIILINSCSVTEEADKKCRQTVRSLHRRHPEAAIILTGCYAQLKPEEAASLEGVAVVAGNDRKGLILEYRDRWLADRAPRREVIPAKDIRHFTPSCSRGDRTRYFLKVQDGCDCWCTYCTIPAARGRSRSATISQLVGQAEKAAAEGGREIVITGVNIGDFGKRGPDGLTAENREDFLGLVKALDSVSGIERYRISSIEPDLLTDEIIDFVASSRAFMPHFHIPLQCGSDAVLKLMRRRYGTDLFAEKIARIRAAMPHAFIGIDIIAGARGETEEEFERSLRFVESLDITRLHVFPYSERPGTKALEIPHQVSREEKQRRVAALMRLSERKLGEFSGRFLGQTRPVLLEHPKPGHPMAGFTDNYLRVNVAGATPELDNRIVPVLLEEIVTGSGGEPEFNGRIAF